jgi:ribonucleoside-diphosphate reductase alpha chain
MAGGFILKIRVKAMATRERLPNRRTSESFTFELHGLRFTATVSRFDDGRIGELFLNNHKHGNQTDTNARDSAIILSFALQHGADIESIRRALCRNDQGRALGPVGAALDLLLIGNALAEPAQAAE